jgi:hypothetical protein
MYVCLEWFICVHVAVNFNTSYVLVPCLFVVFHSNDMAR